MLIMLVIGDETVNNLQLLCQAVNGCSSGGEVLLSFAGSNPRILWLHVKVSVNKRLIPKFSGLCRSVCYWCVNVKLFGCSVKCERVCLALKPSLIHPSVSELQNVIANNRFVSLWLTVQLMLTC